MVSVHRALLLPPPQGTRGAYATDASNYRQVPIGVVIPLSVEAGAKAIAVCREHAAPALSRGGGTRGEHQRACRTQIAQAGTGRTARHLAEVLRGDS